MTTTTAPRIIARTALVAIIGSALASALASVVYAALGLTDILARQFYAEIPVATPFDLSPIASGTTGESFIAYSTVILWSYDALPGPRTQLALSVGAYFALFFAACIVIIVLAARLWRRRPFARLASAAAAVLGVFAIAVSFLGPWLRMSAVEAAVAALGYPTSGQPAGAGADQDTIEQSEWLVPPTFSLQDTDWMLLAFGLVLMLVGALLAAGRRIQRDTEGLV